MNGRVGLGASAVLFGIVLLLWHDAGAWEGLSIPQMPFGAVIADALAIGLIVAGFGLAFVRTVRPASIVLGVVTGIFSLACVPGIVAAPATYASYVNLFEFLAPVCAAIALYVTMARNVARLGIGICTVSFTLAQIVYFKVTADLVPRWMPPDQAFWVILTTVAFGLAAVAMLIDRQARLAMRLTTIMLALFGVLVWVPILIAHPELHFNWSEFALNYVITGAVWAVSDVQSPRTRR